ncbi:hypothetical protein Tsubulata_024968 [Turnera subulata]|uniref:C2 domain-containing protein n=1 Tax=Turnera subulata TaxID=218843 RepID=A0A9Q0JGI1_9ROSI|nr:hypothetical protein Tsubulata_024968 [Turnera subulata]
MSTILNPFQLLELNIISAQDLASVTRKMKTYAVAWVNPNRKLTTRVDYDAHTNPTWNDKFVFRVDDDFLQGDTSAVMIEIYAVHWFRDIHVGTVRAIVGNLIPPAAASAHHHHHHLQLGMRFVALQVRRPSGRPQGILNIGVAILDSSQRSMPLYTLNSSSAVGYRHLMGEDPSSKDDSSGTSHNPLGILGLPELRRTKSDSSSMVGSMLGIKPKGASEINGADLERMKTGPPVKGGSCIVPGSGDAALKKQQQKPVKKKNKAGSLVSGADFGALTKAKYGSEVKGKRSSKASSSFAARSSSLTSRLEELDLRGLNGPNKKKKKSSVGKPAMSDSELGPSPSEVAAYLGKKKKFRVEETESEILGDYSIDLESSMEGLQSKLDRWRAELPPSYNLSDLSSYLGRRSQANSRSTGGRTRRSSELDDDEGAFTCIGRICGLECSIVCGGGSASGRKKPSAPASRRSRSVDSLSFV